jgi:hypothetical protein
MFDHRRSSSRSRSLARPSPTRSKNVRTRAVRTTPSRRTTRTVWGPSWSDTTPTCSSSRREAIVSQRTAWVASLPPGFSMAGGRFDEIRPRLHPARLEPALACAACYSRLPARPRVAGLPVGTAYAVWTGIGAVRADGRHSAGRDAEPGSILVALRWCWSASSRSSLLRADTVMNKSTF